MGTKKGQERKTARRAYEPKKLKELNWTPVKIMKLLQVDLED